MKKAFTLGIFLAAFASLVGARSAHASEGLIDLTNRSGDNTRCYGMSVLMADNQYNILITCRDILYPGGTSVYHYVVWANPTDGGNPSRLGTLGLGKVQFKTRDAFTGLFVTKETNQSPRSPEGQVILQGSLEPIRSLESPGTTVIEEPELGTPEPSATPAAKKSGLNIFRIGGTLGFIALFGIILFVLFITRR